ncbi:MAG: hypothetical protein RLZZ129_1210 [Verrucomicrobiota bacterium]|jgi:molybdopterin-guanine dinucleotide biosynthesis protein A
MRLMSASPVFSAVLLAGGRSSRMGTDKALLPVAGRSLWERQTDVLRMAGAREICFSVRPEQTWVPDGARVVRDAVPGAGPLAGIVAALAVCREPHLAVLAVDLPQMEPAWFKQLLARCAPGIGAVGRRDGFYEPLAAIYPRELLPASSSALARGEYSLQRLIAAAGERMISVEISAVEAARFENWNEPSEAGY